MKLKKHKGLFIPEIEKNPANIEAIQFSHCERSKCFELDHEDCEDCLFCISNIEQFAEWYKQEISKI